MSTKHKHDEPKHQAAKHEATPDKAAQEAAAAETQAKLEGFLPSINEPPQLQHKPVITALMPAFCEIGGDDFTLFISGENFSDKSVIFFAGHDEPTTLNDDGTLSTGVKPSLWDVPTTVGCRVHNGAQPSNALNFEFRAPIDEDSSAVRRRR